MSSLEIRPARQMDRFKRKKMIEKRAGEELVLYDHETNTAYCLNGIAADIWAACKRESSPDEVTTSLLPRWPDVHEEAVWISLQEMVTTGLLEQSTGANALSTSRRELIRKFGFAAAVAFPLAITSVLVPPAAEAASCVSLGESCATKPCCPGLGLGCVAGICVNTH